MPISIHTHHHASLQVVVQQEVEQGDTIGSVDVSGEFAAALVATELMHPHLECNCELRVYKCCCGNYHMRLIALATVGSGEILSANTDTANTTIVQFDGSAHRDARIGGAGAALLQVGPRGYYLLWWGSLSLYPCKDNIVAEAYGAELAMILYSEYVRDCRKEQAPPLTLSTIQGDIKPLIQHLQFAGRFRRSDLVEVVDRFHRLKSRLAPTAQPEYRPREANFLADYLAGEASGSLKGTANAPAEQAMQSSRLEVNLPYELLLNNQAVILGRHQHGRIVSALREVPSCPLSLVETYAVAQGGRQLTLLRQLVTATQKLTRPLCVEYIAAAEDGLGRLYARQVSAQSLSREARYLVYGQTHKEIDMSGAHYEILRRITDAPRLPPIAQLREVISSMDDPCSFAKILPLRLLNTGAERTLAYAREKGYVPANYIVSLFWEIETLRDIHLPKILDTHRTDPGVSFRNRNYHACETVESQFMHNFYRSPGKREQISSAIWLHDEIWVNQEVSDDAIRLAEAEALRSVFPGFRQCAPIFRIAPLAASFAEIRGQLDRLSPGPPLLPDVPRRFCHLLTPQHPSTHFYQKSVDPQAEAKQDRYVERVSKRPRL